MSASVLNPHEPVVAPLHSKRLPLRSYRFGNVEVDFHNAEVRRGGVRLRIQDQPLQVLAALLDRPGEVVTREELRNVLWDGETFVDFDHCLNSAVKRLRDILHDDHDHPHLIETIPRHGYRFIAPVTEISPLAQSGTRVNPSARGRMAIDGQEVNARREMFEAGRRRFAHALWILLAMVLATAGFSLAFRILQARAHATANQARTIIAVLPFRDLSNDASGSSMAAGMTQELITKLGKMDPGRVGVLAGGAVVNYSFGGKLPRGAPKEPGADYVIEGTTRVQGSSVRIAVQLVSVSDQSYVWAESYDAESSDPLAVQQNVAGVVIRAVEEKLKMPTEARN